MQIKLEIHDVETLRALRQAARNHIEDQRIKPVLDRSCDVEHLQAAYRQLGYVLLEASGKECAAIEADLGLDL